MAISVVDYPIRFWPASTEWSDWNVSLGICEREVVVTEWNPFRALDLKRLRVEMRQPIIVNLHNIYRREEIAARCVYESVGRPRPHG